MESTTQYRATQCPSQDVLLAYCNGKLPEIDQETVDSHLATCEVCLAFLDSKHPGKAPAVSHDSKSSMLDETAVQKIRKDPLFQRMVAQIKQFELSVGSDTKPWVPEQRPTKRPSDKKLPENIGPYFVIDELGSGGFANVYLASDREGRRPVAIKVPRADKLETPEQIDAYVEEARKSAKLKHAHIVPAYFFERTPSGCYVVMKYIEGRSLEKAMKAGKLGFERIAEICAEVAGALDYAHKEGLIHRDIKPANILLDTQGVAYVADFGLAIHQDVQHDHKDEFAGTCAYMSPEQVGPGPHYFDHRTDVWSLGVVLYELLTQNKPFPGKDDAVRIDKILNHPVKPPRSINNNVPKELERICLSCLAKDVSTRSASAAEGAESLRAWLQGRRRVFQLRIWGIAALLGIVIIGLFIWVSELGWFGSGIMPWGKKDESPGPVLTVIPENRNKQISLLETDPVVVFGHPQPDPFFSAAQQTYSVGPTTNRWIARVHRCQSEPMHLHATVSLKDWVGMIGIAWQFRSHNQLPGQSNHWFVAEFYRSNSSNPCQLHIQDLTLTPGGVVSPRNLYSLEIDMPKKSTAEMDLVIEDNFLNFSLGHEKIRLEVPLEGTAVQTWLEQGELTVALSGRGEIATFRNATLEPIAPAK